MWYPPFLTMLYACCMSVEQPSIGQVRTPEADPFCISTDFDGKDLVDLPRKFSKPHESWQLKDPHFWDLGSASMD